MSMNAARALEALRGLRNGALSVSTAEIEELIALHLAVESDPDDMATSHWLGALVVEEAGTTVEDPNVATMFGAKLRELEEQLKSDWFRMKSSKETVSYAEANRVTLRRALGILGDPSVMARLRKIFADARVLAPGATYVACPALGAELYAVTHKGFRVHEQLETKIGRFAQNTFADFVRAFDKAEAKMLAFSNDVATLSAHVGHVRKNRDQVVIGLAKAGGNVMDNVSAYQRARGRTNAPDLAVVCTRNAATHGGVDEVARKLREAEKALKRAGFPPTPLVLGCAKSLLGFAPEPGIARFKELHRLLTTVFGRGESIFKHTARLMPAAGMPADIVARAQSAAALLSRSPPSIARTQDVPKVAVALASMVRTKEAISEIVPRFRQVEGALFRAALSDPGNVESDALECVACAGSPDEIVATVRSLVAQLASGRQPTRSDIAIAMSFAKRFAF